MGSDCETPDGACNPASRLKAEPAREEQDQRRDLRIADGEDGLQPAALALGIVVLDDFRLRLTQANGRVPVEILHGIDVAIERLGNVNQCCRNTPVFIQGGRNLPLIGFRKGGGWRGDQDGILHALLRNQFDPVRAENGNREKIPESEFGAKAFRESQGGFRGQVSGGFGISEIGLYFAGEVFDIQRCEPHVHIERRLEIVDIGPEDFGILLHDGIDPLTQPVVETLREHGPQEDGDDGGRHQCRESEQHDKATREPSAPFALTVGLYGKIFPGDDCGEHNDDDKVQPQQPRRGASRRIIGVHAGNGDEGRKHGHEGRDNEEAFKEGPACLRGLLTQYIRQRYTALHMATPARCPSDTLTCLKSNSGAVKPQSAYQSITLLQCQGH